MAEHVVSEAEYDRRQAAEYVAVLTRELAAIARRNGFAALGYLLDMAQMEAESAARRPYFAEGGPQEGGQ
jgi:hypothetical protein